MTPGDQRRQFNHEPSPGLISVEVALRSNTCVRRQFTGDLPHSGAWVIPYMIMVPTIDAAYATGCYSLPFVFILSLESGGFL